MDVLKLNIPHEPNGYRLTAISEAKRCRPKYIFEANPCRLKTIGDPNIYRLNTIVQAKRCQLKTIDIAIRGLLRLISNRWSVSPLKTVGKVNSGQLKRLGKRQMRDRLRTGARTDAIKRLEDIRNARRSDEMVR